VLRRYPVPLPSVPELHDAGQELCPVELEYLPAGQCVQLGDPTPEYLPAAHAMQPVVAPDSE
jgi:hypothetical protein